MNKQNHLCDLTQLMFGLNWPLNVQGKSTTLPGFLSDLQLAGTQQQPSADQ